MTSSPMEGSICVSVNTGGVGIVSAGKCSIAMSNEVRGRPTRLFIGLLDFFEFLTIQN